MEFLGIGPLELLFILIIALIVLGPNDMVKAGRTLGRWMRMIVTSPTWRTLQDASREMRNLPNRLMREAGIEDLQKELPNPRKLNQELGLNQINNELNELKQDISLSAWTTPPSNTTPDTTPSSIVESNNGSDVETNNGSEVESEDNYESPIIETPESSPDSSPLSEPPLPPEESEL